MYWLRWLPIGAPVYGPLSYNSMVLFDAASGMQRIAKGIV